MTTQFYEGIGRRKQSTARVRILSGTGNMTVNGKPLEEYFPRIGDKENILGHLTLPALTVKIMMSLLKWKVVALLANPIL